MGTSGASTWLPPTRRSVTPSDRYRFTSAAFFGENLCQPSGAPTIVPVSTLMPRKRAGIAGPGWSSCGVTVTVAPATVAPQASSPTTAAATDLLRI
jgi:hypothetical protein